MSMIRCDGCDEIGDAKVEWIDGVHEAKSPFRFWCPDCADITWDRDSDILAAIKAQDPDRYEEIKFDACTCRTPAVHGAMLEPPEPKSIRDYDCPVHGYDPNAARDARQDREMGR